MKDYQQEIDRILAEADALPEAERKIFLRRKISRLKVDERRDEAGSVKTDRSGTISVRQALEAAAEGGPVGSVSWTPAGIPWFGTIEQLVHLHECLSAGAHSRGAAGGLRAALHGQERCAVQTRRCPADREHAEREEAGHETGSGDRTADS
ncbi:MAG: hypothetical protein IMZ54_00775 [Acidobacteria bacterium]|nr:hypothetical protein [Acidobacteriota bacterium]